MIYVAQIKDGLVTQVILTTDQYEEYEENIAIVGEENTVGIGWTYKDGKFTAPTFILEE